MRQIRLNTFETNSSSSHSFVITDFEGRYSQEEIMEHVFLWEGGKAVMWPTELEFGRSPFDFLNNFAAKTRYAIAASNGRLVPQITKIWEKYIPGFTGFEFNVEHRIWDEEKQEYVDTDENNPVYEYGYTDDYEIEGWLKKYNVSVEDFLTMRRYIVVCDGDESCIWDKVRDSGLMDKSHILHDSYEEEEEEKRKRYEEELKNENH